MSWPWQRSASTSGAPAEGKPTADDFTRGAVERAVLSEALQHPLTILPAAVAGVALLWSVAVDFSTASLLTVLASGFLGASSWAFQYFIRGETLAARHVEDLRRRRADGEMREVETLQEEFRRAGCHEGAKEARELEAAYQKLRTHLENALREGRAAGAQRFLTLAEETYREGAAILRKALHLFGALRSVDIEKLEAECRRWKRDAAQRSGGDPGEHAALELQIEAHSKRIRVYRERERLLHQLLAESNELESALDTTYLEVIDLGGGSMPAGLDRRDAAARLETAVEAARRVEQRLREAEEGESSADQEYLEAADPHRKRRS